MPHVGRRSGAWQWAAAKGALELGAAFFRNSLSTTRVTTASMQLMQLIAIPAEASAPDLSEARLTCAVPRARILLNMARETR